MDSTLRTDKDDNHNEQGVRDMNRKRVWFLLVLLLGAGRLLAADYSVTTVRPITPTGFDPGNGINLYEITGQGIRLVNGGPYVFQHTDFTGQLSSILFIGMNPAHDFVYVAYTGNPQPILAGFAVTPTGLVMQWQNVFTTGNSTLDLASLTILDNLIIEDAHPAGFAHLIAVLDQSGAVLKQEINEFLVSVRVKNNGNFYYSCRSATGGPYGGVPPATSAVVFDLKKSVSTPVVTATDPTFVRSVCDQ
jgi:hypothetical protein